MPACASEPVAVARYHHAALQPGYAVPMTQDAKPTSPVMVAFYARNTGMVSGDMTLQRRQVHGLDLFSVGDPSSHVNKSPGPARQSSLWAPWSPLASDVICKSVLVCLRGGASLAVSKSPYTQLGERVHAHIPLSSLALRGFWKYLPL